MVLSFLETKAYKKNQPGLVAVIITLRRQRQEDFEFKVSLS
jgi:hypothetical protein